MTGPALSGLIDHGRGAAPADPALRGGRVFELITGDLAERDVAICGDAIVGVSGIMRCCR
jgi:adenine deaminase